MNLSMIRRPSMALFLVAVAALAAPARAVVINFDERAALPPGFSEGMPVAPQYFVDDEYAAQGVVFNSAGGGIIISAPSNPVSAPNVASASRPGVLTYLEPVTATFALGGTPAVVDNVAVTLTNSSSTSTLQAFDIDGALLGSNAGGASATLLVNFPGRIHRVVLQQGPMSFDDFTFNGLTVVPEPAGVGVIGLAAGALLVRRRRP